MNKDIPLLVSLQDIDNLLEDASEQGYANELREMGFQLGGLDGLKATREQLRRMITPVLLQRYDRLATKFRRRAVVPISRDTCSGCHVALPTARVQDVQRGEKVLTCENCGRILFWSESPS